MKWIIRIALAILAVLAFWLIFSQKFKSYETPPPNLDSLQIHQKATDSLHRDYNDSRVVDTVITDSDRAKWIEQHNKGRDRLSDSIRKAQTGSRQIRNSLQRSKRIHKLFAAPYSGTEIAFRQLRRAGESSGERARGLRQKTILEGT